MDKVATCSKPQFISFKINPQLHCNILLSLRTVVSKGPLCLSSIFSIVPVKNSNASVVLFDIEILHMWLSKPVSFFHRNVSLASVLSVVL